MFALVECSFLVPPRVWRKHTDSHTFRSCVFVASRDRMLNHEDKIPEFIDSTTRVVSDVSGVVEIMKGNLRGISKLLASWCKD